MKCPTRVKKIQTFESRTLTLKPIDGYLSVIILIPADFKIVVLKDESSK
jgi:hypothetical protein